MEWISVKDRLPENCESVIGYDPNQNKHDRVNEMFYSELGKCWIFVRDGLDATETVTHWMPLPDPPK
jgi:hypothetical protein